MLGLGPSDRRCKSCRADQFRNGVLECWSNGLLGSKIASKPLGPIPLIHQSSSSAAVVEYIRLPPSKRNDAGENPAGSAIARWCQSSTAAC